MTTPRYDRFQSYDWNYEHAPAPPPVISPPSAPLNWTYAGLPASSPVAISAGPLLNGKWVLYYASLGFDILTYKTVRSRFRACYPAPNLQPVSTADINNDAAVLPAAEQMDGNWAVSFGMPSRSPDVWRADIEATRKALPKNKILSVSIVATPEPNWSIEQVADDYAICARWAVESGADCAEANFSCPNVSSCDAQLYQQPELAGIVAAKIKHAMGVVPLLIKIGHVTDVRLATQLVQALATHCQALVMVNCISAKVRDNAGHFMFEGEKRGIAGPAIRAACIQQVAMFSQIVRQQSVPLDLIGVGGIGCVSDVMEYLATGCRATQLATAAMVNPEIATVIGRAAYPAAAQSAR